MAGDSISCAIDSVILITGGRPVVLDTSFSQSFFAV